MDLTKVVFTGDSLTDGGEYDFDTGSHTWQDTFGIDLTNCWPNIVARTFKFPYVNTAVSGEQIANIAADIDKYILDYNPTHLFIEGGCNDWGISRADADTIANNMETVISTVKAAGVGITLMWIPLNYEAGSFATQPGETNPIPALPTKYQAIAKKYNIDFLYLEGSALGTSPNVEMKYKLADGGVHFSPAGHLKMAQLVIEHICDIYHIPNAGRVKAPLKKS